ncbi:Uncharacterised protein [Mycobacteroides abscessus subsp. abscessus]|nr:Uncharacterised protein [Mycobacteroides abscessus subsp. abscessus]
MLLRCSGHFPVHFINIKMCCFREFPFELLSQLFAGFICIHQNINITVK